MPLVLLKPLEGSPSQLVGAEVNYLTFNGGPFFYLGRVSVMGRARGIKARLLKKRPAPLRADRHRWKNANAEAELKKLREAAENDVAITPPWILDECEDAEVDPEAMESFLSLSTISGDVQSEPPYNAISTTGSFVLALKPRETTTLCVGIVGWTR